MDDDHLFFVKGGPRDPLKKRYSLSDSIMHLIEEHGEHLKTLRDKSERYITGVVFRARAAPFRVGGGGGGGLERQKDKQVKMSQLGGGGSGVCSPGIFLF